MLHRGEAGDVSGDGCGQQQHFSDGWDPSLLRGHSIFDYVLEVEMVLMREFFL